MEDKAKYLEAVKTAKAAKPKENLMVIQFGWDNKIVLPYKEGASIMAALASAEAFSDYGDKKGIRPMERGRIAADIMSPEEYQQHKIAALLRVPFEDVKKYQEEQETTT